MNIAVVSNSDTCIPLLYSLQNSKAGFIFFLASGSAADKGREAVIAFCGARQIPITTGQEGNDALYAWLEASRPDIVFIVGYSRILRMDRLPQVPYGIYNIHFGSLPAFRGPSPVFWQLRQDSPTICVAIHTLSKSPDAGPIAWQKELKNEPYFNFTLVTNLLQNALVEGVSVILQTLRDGHAVPAAKQDETRAAYYKRPELKDVLIGWSRMSATEVCALIRACNGWNNGAMTVFNGGEVRIADAFPVSLTIPVDTVPGTVLAGQEAITIGCSGGTAIQATALYINGALVPARFAAVYGLAAGSRFS